MVAGAMRHLGIPARWLGTGTQQGPDDWDDERATACWTPDETAACTNGHRYTQVWLGSHYGWICFDATPSKPAFNDYDPPPPLQSQWRYMTRAAVGPSRAETDRLQRRLGAVPAALPRLRVRRATGDRQQLRRRPAIQPAGPVREARAVETRPAPHSREEPVLHHTGGRGTKGPATPQVTWQLEGAGIVCLRPHFRCICSGATKATAHGVMWRSWPERFGPMQARRRSIFQATAADSTESSFAERAIRKPAEHRLPSTSEFAGQLDVEAGNPRSEQKTAK